MSLKFTKMQGLGNDFVVIDAIQQNVNLTSEQVRHIADRRFGIGCDQVLLVEESSAPDADFDYRIFNADGSEVQQCGNGARCFVRFVHDKKLTTKSTIRARTQSGVIAITLEPGGEVTVDMGKPDFNPASLPFTTGHQSDRYQVNLSGESVQFGAVSMGNPHAVILVENIDQAAVQSVGSQLESHEQFPSRVNVGFMQVVDRDRIKLRVFERGAGETLACGTGACAAAVIGQQWDLLNKRVTVELPGGNLLIDWQGVDTSVMMTGPAVSVFEGQIEI